MNPTTSSTHAPRTCGACTACCVHLPIPAGHVGPGAKPAGVACSRLGSGGCRFYQSRPAACAGFHCAWLKEPLWPDRWRPDASGALCLLEWVGDEFYAAAVYEIEAGAFGRAETEEIIATLRETTALVVTIDRLQRRHALAGQGPLQSTTVRLRNRPQPTVSRAA